MIVNKDIIEKQGKRVSPSSRFWIYKKEVYTSYEYIYPYSPREFINYSLSSEDRTSWRMNGNYLKVEKEQKKATVLKRYERNKSHSYILKKCQMISGAEQDIFYFFSLQIEPKIQIKWTKSKRSANKMTLDYFSKMKKIAKALEENYLMKGEKCKKIKEEEMEEEEKTYSRFDLMDID